MSHLAPVIIRKQIQRFISNQVQDPGKILIKDPPAIKKHDPGKIWLKKYF
jgi:hypothetical protein